MLLQPFDHICCFPLNLVQRKCSSQNHLQYSSCGTATDLHQDIIIHEVYLYHFVLSLICCWYILQWMHTMSTPSLNNLPLFQNLFFMSHWYRSLKISSKFWKHPEYWIWIQHLGKYCTQDKERPYISLYIQWPFSISQRFLKAASSSSSEIVWLCNPKKVCVSVKEF